MIFRNFDQLDETSPILIHSRNVVIQPSSRTLENDSKASNKITTQNMVDYSWEDRYTLGHLISYHAPTCLIAYVLSISNNYMIRILNEENSSRCLIKDFCGEITDIAFSKSRIPYIASIDINGSVKVNKVNNTPDMIECQLILHIKAVPSLESVKSMKVSYSRVMWCWHNDSDERVVDESEAVGTNISLLLGVVHGSTFEVMQIDTIESELLTQAEEGRYEPRIDREGLGAISSSFQDQFFESESLSDLFLPYLIYTASGEDSKITSLAISSDAAAFAVALRDGTVRFFTLDGSVSSGLKEAYSWRPFNGEAVWSLLFLDDCRAGSNIDAFWCHVVVGGAFNRELKLFRCDKWDCIQTVSFQSPVTPCLLSAHIDQSARYLIMSDIRRKALYVLELDSIDNDKTKLFKSVQEFVLTQSLLSFDINTIVAASTSDDDQQIVIKMFTITKGAFQKMRVTYVSRGHRLKEILADVSDDGADHDSISVSAEHEHQLHHMLQQQHHELMPAVSNSLLTHVSSLPHSANSSFQDPAIISTHSTPGAMKSLPMEMPPALQHLFPSMDDHRNRKPCGNHDSGEESGDEESLEMQRDQHKIMGGEGNNQKFPGDEDEECGFPLPPYGANGGWHTDNNIAASTEAAASNTEKRPVELVDIGSNAILLQRFENVLLAQQRQLEALTKAVSDLQRLPKQPQQPPADIGRRCTCKEELQRWMEQTLHEVNVACHEAVVDQLDRRLRESVDAAIPHICSTIGARLDEVVRNKLVALDSLTREFLNDLLHDKKFIGAMATGVRDSMDKPLRSLYGDMIRKDLVPGLGKTLDKLFADVRDVLRDGVKDVLGGVDESNKMAMRALEDRFVSTVQRGISADVAGKLQELSNEVNSSRTYLADGIVKQRDQISRLHDAMSTMKDSFTDTEHSVANRHAIRGKSLADVVDHQEQVVAREMKINRLIISGDCAGALSEALAMTDMRVLLYACTRIPTKRVLSANPQKQSPLQSSSVLALIQQLSRDFHEQFEIKFEYLFDALLSLDTSEPGGIKGHATKVLSGVVRRLQTHNERESSPVLKDKITVLLRLVTSRLDSSPQE